MIKVGEYARTTDGMIGKVVVFTNDEYHIRIGKYDIWKCGSCFIKKHSENLIDLIEVGDFVNGTKVKYIDDCKGAMREFYYDEKGMEMGYWEEYIKTVLTHEQYALNCYKVGEEL